MSVNTSAIQEGMEVYCTDGEKIGTVKDVWPDTGTDTAQSGDVRSVDRENSGLTMESVPSSDISTGPTTTPSGGSAGVYDTTSTSDMATTTTQSSSGRGYIHVEQGGILGIGAKDLYIPFDAVVDMVPGQNLTVNCTKDDCADRYGNKPASLEAGTGAGTLT